MSFDERELVPLAKSRCSTSATVRPRVTASSATPAPVAPPPITTTSNRSLRIRSRFAARVFSESSGPVLFFALLICDHPNCSRSLPGWQSAPPREAVRLRPLHRAGTMLRDTPQRINMPGLLEGIRVIDFGRFIAAPYCAMLLADFGADVIRVERREGGEDRRLGPVTGSGEGGLFLNLNRNKRGMTLDLAHPIAEEIIRRLVHSADIVIVNLPIGVMRKLKLDYDHLRQIKEEIIL